MQTLIQEKQLLSKDSNSQFTTALPPDSGQMDQCAQCGQQGGADGIRLCAACKAIGYCSRDCQKRHWSSHKRVCKKTTTRDKSPAGEESPESPRLPPPAGDRGTKAAEKVASAPHDGSTMDMPLTTCQKCGLQRQGMNRCGSCRGVTYCSRDCQRADWKAHKAVCRAVVKVSAEDDGPTAQKEAVESGKLQGATGGAQKEWLSSSPSGLPLTPPISWEEARSRAAKLYPRHRIVDKFRELRPDWMWVVREEMVVAVLKIGALYPHLFRHGRCLEDAEGNPSFVLFHTPKDPRPHFRYEQLREGNFLCYEHARMHLFMEGTVGLRIDEAKEVHILEPIRKRGKSSSSAAPILPPTTPQQWEAARSTAHTMFPDMEIVDSLQDIDHEALTKFMGLLSFCAPEMTWNNPDGYSVEDGEVMKVMVLVQLVSPIPSSPMHSWVVKDRKEKSAQLNFQFEGIPSPHFRFQDLQKGQFVCVSQLRVTRETERHEMYTIWAKDPRRAASISL